MKKYLTLYFILAFILTSFVINYFFLYHMPGISAFLFMLIIILLFETGKFLFHEKLFWSWYQLLIIPLLYFSLVFYLRTDEFVLFLSTMVIAMISPFYFITSAHPKFLEKFSLLEVIEMLLKVIAAPFTVISSNFTRLNIIKPKSNVKTPLWTRNFIIGCFITIPVFLIVFALLKSADQIFSNFANDMFDNIIPDISFDNLGKLVFAMFLSGIIWVLFAGFIESSIFEKAKIKIGLLDHISNDKIIPVMLMSALNLLYIIFVIIQFGYLFGGENFTHKQGIVFSEYAIKGFWEMIAVSLINIVVLYFVQTRFTLESMKSKLALMIPSVLIIASTIVMLISSHSRLRVYENGYGYTTDRLIPHTFLIFILMVFLILTINMFLKDNIRRKVLNIGIFTSIIIFLAGFSMFSMEKFIVKNNIENYYAKKDATSLKLDLDYINGLGIEGAVETIENFDNPKFQYALALQDKESTGCGKVCTDKNIQDTMQDAHDLWGLSGWRSKNMQYDKLEKLFAEQYYDITKFDSLKIDGFELNRNEPLFEPVKGYRFENDEDEWDISYIEIIPVYYQEKSAIINDLEKAKSDNSNYIIAKGGPVDGIEYTVIYEGVSYANLLNTRYFVYKNFLVGLYGDNVGDKEVRQVMEFMVNNY